MLDGDCRLCFEKKPSPIGIFTGQGVCLKIAETIRMHFPDEVLENDDHLPRFVCSHCWTKLTSFHEFYKAVEESKTAYLRWRSAPEKEIPDFLEINCEIFVEDVIPSVKEEPLNDDVGDAVDEPVEMEEIEDALAAAEMFEEEQQNPLEELAEDISKQSQFKCGICEHPLRTSAETVNHYRNAHNETAYHKQIVKCCDRQLLPYDIRDHNRYHSDPYAFKCKKCVKRFIAGRHLKIHEPIHFPKEFECDICKRKFISRQNVRSHILRVHTSVKPYYECNICKKRVATKNRLEAHQQRHIPKQCEICKKSFPKPSILKRHFILSHTKSAYECEICKICFASEDVLREHKIYHTDPEAFKCNKCQKIFTHRRSLKAHLLTHSTKKFECDICKSRFFKLQYVRHHILRMHTKAKFECVICKMRLPTEERLAAHQKKHVLKHCSICNKGFLQLGGLKDHIIRTHTVKQYECATCKKSFATDKILQYHIQKVHERKFNRVCHICAKIYATDAAFQRHVQSHSGVEQPRVNCLVCGKSYKNEIVLKDHMTIHEDEGKTFPCPHCPKISPHRRALKAHIYEMHNFKVKKCNFCEKVCKTNQELREHVATHTGEYLYDCAHCSQKFRSHSSRSQHYKRYHPVE